MNVKIKKYFEFDAKYIKVNAGVRYWEDSIVNGAKDINPDDTNEKINMPCVEATSKEYIPNKSDSHRWVPIIELDSGRITNWEIGFTASVHYKVCDDFTCEIIDIHDNVIALYDGYVPDIMCPKEEGYGDYIIMDINSCGYIQNWNKYKIEDLLTHINEL